jgi:hypothetical protein
VINGGTQVVIKADIPNRLKAATIYFGNRRAPFLGVKPTESLTVFPDHSDNLTLAIPNSTTYDVIVFSPSNLGGNWVLPMTVNLSVVFNDTTLGPMKVNGTYTFYPDPNITSIAPTDHIMAGGTKMTILGENLNSSYAPSITATLIVWRKVPPRTMREERTLKTLDCVFEQSLIECSMAQFQLSPDVVSSLEPSTRRRRESAWVAARPQRDLGALVSQGVDLAVLFDGILAYTNLTRSLPQFRISLHDVPEIPQFGDDRSNRAAFYPNHHQVMEIRGKHMLRGCRREDYHVRIGNSTAEIVLLEDDRIQFVPPINAGPAEDPNVYWNCSDALHLVVKVGEYSASVGCVDYVWSLNPPKYETSLGYIGVAVGAAIIIAVVITVCTKTKATKYKK